MTITRQQSTNEFALVMPNVPWLFDKNRICNQIHPTCKEGTRVFQINSRKFTRHNNQKVTTV